MLSGLNERLERRRLRSFAEALGATILSRHTRRDTMNCEICRKTVLFTQIHDFFLLFRLMGEVPLKARRLFCVWIPGLSQPKNSFYGLGLNNGLADAGMAERGAISLSVVAMDVG